MQRSTLVIAFALLASVVRAAEPTPWPPQYKIKPNETARLTPADVVGPDGLVYPNWTNVGIRGGIPAVAVKITARDCGAFPDDDRDDADALLAAVEKLARTGGAILLEPGAYHLDRPIMIRHDGIVIRGAGREKTRILFRYNISKSGIRLAQPWESNQLHTDSPLVLHADPAGLEKLEILVNGAVVASKSRAAHWGNTFSLSAFPSAIFKQVPADAPTLTVKGVATYKDQTTREESRTMNIQRKPSPTGGRWPGYEAAIAFCGVARPPSARPIPLARDGKRGDLQLTLHSTAGLKPSDTLLIDGPMSDRWRAILRNECKWGTYRRNLLEISAIDGNTVRITDPLRIEFPVADESTVQKLDPIRRCGIEDLTIELTENLWLSAVVFSAAWECWARNVTVKMCGRFPVYGHTAKRCVIQDCIFDDAWFKGGGGTAYAGWEHSYDCLMTDCTTYKLRHAPCVQWSASGNVIRKSKFVDSDMQWHSGWTNENLFEMCEVSSKSGNGGYGHGAWASPPNDAAHGPNGPRNVIYNCDISGEKAGIWLGGMNENWMILYNRISAAGAEAVYVKTTSFDHIIRGNRFTLANPRSPAVTLATPDCPGMEIYDNVIVGGNGKTVGGKSAPAVERNNKLLPAGSPAVAPRVAVPSIYDWQLQHAARTR